MLQAIHLFYPSEIGSMFSNPPVLILWGKMSIEIYRQSTQFDNKYIWRIYY